MLPNYATNPLSPCKTISLKQQAMLLFIAGFIHDRGYPPTYEEMRVGLSMSTKSLVDYPLTALEAAGHIERDAKTPRGLRLVEASFHQIVGVNPSAVDIGVE